MVKAWHEKINIPTYEVGKKDKNPMFLEKRVYQGSSGVVYPYPVIEKVEDEKKDKIYHAIFIENEYIKIMILPELGGRVQMAYDKIKRRHFVYYNHVIKPALVGLTGPWISGGIEFNWPQHHRPSTFSPIDSNIEKNKDGSITVWVSEIEQMFHQKGMAGFTLHPGKAYLEIKAKLYNPTPITQTFLWWANPAVAVNDFYQSVFPPDVNAVFDHGKRDVSTFPIATGTYYKVDYSAGVDISNYKNLPVPTSYMAINSHFNFVGGYENDTQAGILHVANHNISPGKKQWTWGNGDFGRAWDRNLTDNDGPYIELMAGVYTDNQPDFTWLQPYEEKTFTQFFLPYRELGILKNASKDLLLNIHETDNKEKMMLQIFATSKQDFTITLWHNNIQFHSEEAILSPEKIYNKELSLNNFKIEEIKVIIYDKQHIEKLCWKMEDKLNKEIPQPAQAISDPKKIHSIEELYLSGLHLEQYRHATYNPTDYYKEALRREPGNVQNNNALGLWYLRRGRFEVAKKYLEKAVETQLTKNPNPYDGEPLYNLGLTYKFLGNEEQAYTKFYKACWNAAWQDVGYFSCAQISIKQNRLNDALEEINRSLIKNYHNHKGRHLKALILRKLGRTEEAIKLIKDSIKLDAFNWGCYFENYLLTNNCEYLKIASEQMKAMATNYEETALNYVAAGAYNEALMVLDLAIKEKKCNTIGWYYYAWIKSLRKDKDTKEAFNYAANKTSDYCFPNRLEDILALQTAIKLNPQDSKASYYLGNLFYDKRQYELAISYWEKSLDLNKLFPTVYRNLALAYFNKRKDEIKGLNYMEKAFKLCQDDERVFMELDQLYKRLNYNHETRLKSYIKYESLIERRYDLLIEKATLLNQLGRYEDAKIIIDKHQFHPWEGGEGKVIEQYQIARTEIAKNKLKEKKYTEAISFLEECLFYPKNLGEGKLVGAQDNDFNYYLGCAYEGLKQIEKAKAYFKLATTGSLEPSAAIYYYDQKPDKIFYQGLAYLKLNNKVEAEKRFNKLIQYGKQHMNDQVKIDFFAVSLPDILIWEDNLNKKNIIHCNYLIALGHFGLGELDKGKKFLLKAEKLDSNHQGIKAVKTLIKNKLI